MPIIPASEKTSYLHTYWKHWLGHPFLVDGRSTISATFDIPSSMNSLLTPVVTCNLAFSHDNLLAKPFVMISAFISLDYVFQANLFHVCFAAIETACVLPKYLMLGDKPFFSILIIAVLSSYSVSFAFRLKTLSQILSAGSPMLRTAVQVAINSASAVELETQFCFLDEAIKGKQLLGPTN